MGDIWLRILMGDIGILILVFAFGTPVAVILGAVLWHYLRGIHYGPAWKKALKNLDIVSEDDEVTFQLNGQQVILERLVESGKLRHSTIRVRIRLDPAVPETAEVKTRLAKPKAGFLGESSFDLNVGVSCESAVSQAAWLSASVRKTLIEATEQGAIVQNRWIWVELEGADARNPNTMVNTARQISTWANALTPHSSDIDALLAYNALEDPSPGVRRTNLKHLIIRNTNADVIAAAHQDPDPNIRVQAAVGVWQAQTEDKATSDARIRALWEALEDTPLDDDLKGDFKKAYDAIMAPLMLAEGGKLSLSEIDDQGSLSLADTEGKLSLDDANE